MKIKKLKKFSVLSKPLFDESMIDRIYPVDESIIDPQTQEPKIISEDYIDYRFYFMADLRKAINNDLGRVRFSIRKDLKQTRYPFFNDLDNKNSKGIVAALFAKNRDIEAQMFTSDKEGLLYRKNIDLFKNFNNFKIRNAKRLNDRELFGTILTNKIVNTKKMRKLGSNQQLSQKTLTSINSELLNARSFRGNYEKAVSLGFDPPSLLFPTDDETPADPRKSGTFYRKSITTGTHFKDSCLSTLRYQAIGTSTSDNASTDKQSVAQLPKGSSVAVTTMQPNRVRIIPVNVTMKKSDFAGRKNFFVVLDVIDSKGLIAQTLVIKIDHEKNVDDYYAPISGVESNITFSFDSNKKSARICLKKEDPNIAGCDIYIREVSETFPMQSSQFKKMKRVQFRQGGTTYSDSIRYPVTETFTLPYVEDKMTIMRVVPISKTGKVFGNFSSSVKKNGPFVPYRAALSTYCNDEGIVIKLENASSNTTGVVFERRDLTIKERNFSKVLGPLEVDENNLSIQNVGVGAASLKSKGGRGIFRTLDRSVKEGHLYEYRARLYLREGVTRTSIMSRFETFITPMEFVSTVLGDIKVTPVQSPPLRTEVSGLNSAINISFSIDFNVAPTDADKIMEALSTAGLSSLYTDEINEVKSSLQNLIFFNIERFNTETGETFYLGSFPPGKTIVDDGITTDALCPIMGQRYMYRVTPCLVQPDVAVQSISRTATSRTEPSPVLGSTTFLRNPSTYAKLRTDYNLAALQAVADKAQLQLDYINIKTSKNFSRESFERGTVPTSNSLVSLADFSTGDYIDKFVSTGYETIKVKNVSVSMGKRAGPIVRWRSAGSATSRNFVDFFIVLVKKQGEKYIAGTCHRVVSDSFRFVDFSNKDYVGVIEYSIKPVFLGGKTGEEISVGTTMMLDRNTSFRRGN